jgi:hypothetical protein
MLIILLHTIPLKRKKKFHFIISFHTGDDNFAKDRVRTARQAGDDTNDKNYL